MSNFNLVTDARLAQGSYFSNNQSNTAVIDGWNPILVKLDPGQELSKTFGAQLYQKDGQYKVVFRGTEGNVSDWAQNLKYGTFQWSDEFKDTVAFMAKAVVQVANEKFGGRVEEAVQVFTTTGHSQGGFQAELAALMFGVKGTSLDGMGSTGVVAQFRTELNKAMQDNGAGDLIRTDEVLTLKNDDFLTRIYTAVGRLGVHTGETDGAWSWSATKLVAVLNPALATIAVVGGLRAHMIADIVANEELRERNPLWRAIGDAGDISNPFNTPTQLAQNVASQWASVQVADASGSLPQLPDSSHVQNQLQSFLEDRSGQNYDQQTLGKNVMVRMEGGDTLMIYADGTIKVLAKVGDATTVREYAKDGSLQTARQERLDGQGNTIVNEQGVGFEGSMTVSSTGQVISARSNTYQGTQLKTTTEVSTQTINNQTVKVTETVNHLAQGTEVASSKELVTSAGARIVNSTTADGHISEEAWATVDGKQTLQSSKVLSYSQAERDVAALDVSLAGLELMQALRSGNKLQAAGSLIRLVNQAQVASNQMPTLGAIGTGFSGAVSLISALDSWGDASDGERIALTARAVLGANEVAKAFSADGNTGFLQNSAALGALQGVVALASLEDTLKSGNPFAIASTFMALTNAAVATGMVSAGTAASALGTTAASQAAVFGPQVMIAVAICSILFGSLFGDDPEYPAPPPAGTAELGVLADGTLGMLFKDGDGHLYQTRSLNGQLVWQETQIMSEDRGHWVSHDVGDSLQSYWVSDIQYWDEPLNQVRNNQDFGLGARVLSERLSGLIADLQAQAGQDGQHLLLERLPSVSVHGYPSFDGNGVNNFFFALKFNNAISGAEQMMATAHQDLAGQFKEVASYAGALVGATEWAQIQAKQAAGDATVRAHATETEGQYVDRLSGDKAGDSLQSAEQAKAQADNNRQSYSLLTLDLEGDGISKRAKAEAGMSLEDVQADTTQGVTRLDVDNDGYMELTEWVGSKEAILGIDRNGDGHLSAATELLTGGELSDAAENLGLKRLAFFDANADGQLDKLDAYFNSFKLWLDINGDARTGVGEVYSLTDAGIQSIHVNTGAVTFKDGQTLTLQKTQLSADVRGVSVTTVPDGKGGVMAGQYMVRQEGKDAQLNLTADAATDLSEILKLVKPGQSVSAEEKQRLTELAVKYGVDLSNPAALLGLGGGGNMAGSPTETTATAGDVFSIDQAPNAAEVKAALRAYFEQVSINPDAGPALAHRVLSAQEDSALKMTAADLLGGLAGVTLVSVQDARRGTVGLDAQGQVVFTPQANQHGTSYFTYTAQDAQGKTSTAMVWLNVAPVNDSPTASGDEFSLQEDNSLALTAAQLLANDADADIATDSDEALRITAVDSAVHGQVRLVDGQVVFTPDADHHGTASFRYTLSDAAGASHQATVQLKVDGVNDAPVLLQALPLQRVDEDQRLMVAAADLLASVQDVDTATDGHSLLVSEVTDVSHGSAQIDADGNLWFAPDANFNGTATLRYWIKDNLGASVGVWASVTVAAVNDAPVLVEALAQKTLDEDRTLLLTAASLLATVRDADVGTNADVLRVERVSDVSHGQASLDGDGNVLYKPDANFNGQAVLRYWVTDSAGASVGVWASFKVNAVNDGPVAVSDSLSVLEDNTLTLSTAQLLANDTDADLLDAAGDTLTVTAVGQASHGTVSLKNGVVTFTADADWQGAASFQYTVADAAGASSEGTAHVTVIGVNDAPVLTNKQDKILAKEDTLLRVEAATLLAYARDVDQSFGDVLKVMAVAGATKGVASLQADGSVLFKPNANANGDAVLTYQVTDLQGQSVLVAVTINIDAVNDAPIARLDAYDQAKEDTTIRIAQSVFINNDSDVDWTTGQMDVLRVTQVSQVQGGTAYIDKDGTVVFSPTTDFNGQANLVYTLSDGNGGTATNTLKINVAAVNDVPVVVRQLSTQTVNEDSSLTVSAATLLATVDDVDVRSNAQTLRVSSVTDAVNGAVRLDASGNVVFTPNANFNGNATFRYWVSDSEGASVGAWANVVVSAVNDAPYQVSTLPVQSVNEDNTLTVVAAALLATVSDVDVATNGQKLRVNNVTDVSNGTATLDGSGNVMFTPTTNFNGMAQFRYWVTDDAGASVSAWASVKVNPINDAPVMLRDLVVQSVNEDNTLTIAASSILVNVSDVDVSTNGQKLRVFDVTETTNGSARVDASGNVVFTPNANFNGSATLRYWVTDDAGASVSALARITVNAVNDAPLVVRDLAVQSVNEDNVLTVSAAAMLATVNDADMVTNGQRLRVLSVSDASNGSVRLDASGNAVFTPYANFNGSAQFKYAIADDAGATAWAWARITVNAVNDAPTPMAQRSSSLEDETKTFAAQALIANAALVDPDVQTNGDVLRISAVSMASGSAAKGNVWLDAGGNVVFKPTANMNGPVAFTYTVADRAGATGGNTITLDVAAVNDAPTANATNMVTSSGTEDSAKWIAFSELVRNFSDVDGDSLTVRSVTSSYGGQAQINGANVVFTPNKDLNISRDGYASFSYTVSDASGATATATALLPFANVNDAPVAAYKRIESRAYEDTDLRIGFSELISGAYDADRDALSLQSVRALGNGTAWIDWANQQVVFRGGSNVNGWSGFDYTLRDPSGATSTQRVDINVIPVNDNPTLAKGGMYVASVWEDGHYASNNQDSNYSAVQRITLATVGASDVDSSSYGFAEVWGQNNVTVWREGNDLLYRLKQNYTGKASFNYKVRDNQGGWADGQVNLDVMAQNDKPWLIGLPVWEKNGPTSMGGQFNARVYGYDADGSNTAIRSSIGIHPYHGDLTYTQAQYGQDAHSYQMWGKTYSSGAIPPAWDIAYRNRYGNGYNGAVSMALDVSDDQGGWARQYINTTHQGSVASRGGKPVAIDLNGDGIHYTNLDDSKVLFDINGDGVKDLLSWTAADDGLVVFDKDGDGLIQDLDEVSFLSYLTGAMTDLEGLAGFDTDKDGRLTANDALWTKFGVWQDKNQDGVTDAGEFKTLDAWGIEAIDLKSDQMMDQVGDVYIMGRSTFTRTDGSTGEVADAAFRYLDAADTSGMSQPKTFNIDIEGVIRKRLEDAHNQGASDEDLNAMLQKFIADVANAGRTTVDVAATEAEPWTDAMYADWAVQEQLQKEQLHPLAA